MVKCNAVHCAFSTGNVLTHEPLVSAVPPVRPFEGQTWTVELRWADTMLRERSISARLNGQRWLQLKLTTNSNCSRSSRVRTNHIETWPSAKPVCVLTTLIKAGQAVCWQCSSQNPQAPGGWPRRTWSSVTGALCRLFRGADPQCRVRPGLLPCLLRRCGSWSTDRSMWEGWVTRPCKGRGGTLGANVSH